MTEINAFQVLNAFALITGLWVNWSKSLSFPIDPTAREIASPDLPLQWVEHVRYLGFEISRQASDYIALNLSPVVQEVQLKLKAWESAPIAARAHQNEGFAEVYLFRHTPRWIPKSFFTRLNKMFFSFYMGPSISQI